MRSIGNDCVSAYVDNSIHTIRYCHINMYIRTYNIMAVLAILGHWCVYSFRCTRPKGTKHPRARNTQGRVCRESVCNRVPWYEWYAHTLLLGPAFAIGRALMNKNALHCYVRSSWLSWKGLPLGWCDIIIWMEKRLWSGYQRLGEYADDQPGSA